MDSGDETEHRSTLFESGNKVSFARPVDEIARAWWIEAFLKPHGLTPEGMGELLTKSQAASKSIVYNEIDGTAHTFSLRIDGSLGSDAGIWLVERSLHLDGSAFNAERMFVSPAGDGAGIGRNLMHDLIDASDILGVTRINLEADRIGRYAWLRMGFVPDRSSWRTIQVEAARFVRRHVGTLGRPRVEILYDAVVQGDPRTARWIAALVDPVESGDMYDDFGKPEKVPLGRAFFLEASPNWAGSFDFDPESRRIAREYVQDLKNDR